MLFDHSETASIQTLNRDICLPQTLIETAGVQHEIFGFWEEHCVECGAPACYTTCPKYLKTLSGRCRRFVNGILRVKNDQNNEIYGIEFRPWGKLELCYSGKELNVRWVHLFKIIDIVMGRICQWCTKLLPQLPWNKNPIAFYRALRRRVVLGKSIPQQTQLTWIIRCFSKEKQTLRCSVMNSINDEIYTDVLEIDSSGCIKRIDLPPLSRGARLQLFSIEGGESPIYFTTLSLVRKDTLKTGEDNAQTSSRKYIKCVIWDLDNTLWDGILVEDGFEGIKLRDVAVKTIKELDRRGIVNSICSKNNYEDAWDCLKKFGIEEFFIYPEINWNSKSRNISSIVKNINIGIDSVAFVDDSFAERGEVAEQHPLVKILRDDEVDEILGMDIFNPPLEGDGSWRRKSYLSEMKRKKVENEVGGSRLEFLRMCEIQLTCSLINDDAIAKRCWELVNRTNQLTLAANRYTWDEFQALIKTTEVWAISCKDKYGDYGIVGLLSLTKSQTVLKVHEFVMSCRVAKKMCEQSVLLSAIQKSRNVIQSLVAEVVYTGRNIALVEAFDALPFSKRRLQDKSGLQQWRYELSLGKCQQVDDIFMNCVEWEKN